MGWDTYNPLQIGAPPFIGYRMLGQVFEATKLTALTADHDVTFEQDFASYLKMLRAISAI
jgi:hypothetical protein